MNKKQPRDEKGRFLSWDWTHNRKYVKIELQAAFLAGLNQRSSWLKSSRLWELYKTQNNIE